MKGVEVTWRALGCTGVEAADSVGVWKHAGMLNHGSAERTCIKRTRDGIRMS